MIEEEAHLQILKKEMIIKFENNKINSRSKEHKTFDINYFSSTTVWRFIRSQS